MYPELPFRPPEGRGAGAWTGAHPGPPSVRVLVCPHSSWVTSTYLALANAPGGKEMEEVVSRAVTCTVATPLTYRTTWAPGRRSDTVTEVASLRTGV